MTFEEAIIASVREYYRGKDPENYYKEKGEVRYTREFFDKLEADLVEEPSKKKSKDVKEKTDDES